MGRLLETIAILGIVYFLMTELRDSDKINAEDKPGTELFRWLAGVGAKGMGKGISNTDMHEEPELTIKQTIIPPKDENKSELNK